MTEPPLTWTIDVQALRGGHSPFSYQATEQECAALAVYITVTEVGSFGASVRVKAIPEDRYKVDGRYSAEVTQASIISLEPVFSRIEEEFSVIYAPAIALDGESRETIDFEVEGPEPLVNGVIGIGALLTELLAVAVEPYPRNEGETFEWNADGSEKRPSAFAELVHLKRTPDSGGKE